MGRNLYWGGWGGGGVGGWGGGGVGGLGVLPQENFEIWSALGAILGLF